MEISTVPIAFVRHVLAAAEQHQVAPHSLLHTANINPELLASNSARVPAGKYNRLLQAAGVALQDECIGFFPRPIKLGTFAMMCHACIHLPTLGKVLERYVRFYNLVTDNFSSTLEVDGEQARYSLQAGHNSNAPEQFMTICLMAIGHRFCSWIINQSITLDHASCNFPRPDMAKEFNFLFGSPVHYNAPTNSLVFSARYLDLPIVQTEQTLKPFLKYAPLDLLGSPDNDRSLVRKVRHLIQHQVAQEFPEFDRVAEQLHFTAATLRRRLRAEGSSYQQIKDDIRRDTAIYHLSKGSLSMEDIAAQVGFSEPTSFFRAFRRWTGTTPRTYLLGGD